MTKNAEITRKKIDFGDPDANSGTVLGDPGKGGGRRQLDGPLQLQLQEFERHSKNIIFAMSERQNFMAKKRFLDRGDELLSTFEYFSNVVRQVSDYTLDNYWRFVMDSHNGDTSNFKDGSVLSHILRMCNERIV